MLHCLATEVTRKSVTELFGWLSLKAGQCDLKFWLNTTWLTLHYYDFFPQRWRMKTLKTEPPRLLGAFAKFRKGTISFVMSVRPSARPPVCPHGTSGLPHGGFSWNFIFEYFSKMCGENSSFIKIKPEERVLYTKTNIHFDHISLVSSWNEKCFRQKL
jgi:hypothetical protein